MHRYYGLPQGEVKGFLLEKGPRRDILSELEDPLTFGNQYRKATPAGLLIAPAAESSFGITEFPYRFCSRDGSCYRPVSRWIRTLKRWEVVDGVCHCEDAKPEAWRRLQSTIDEHPTAKYLSDPKRLKRQRPADSDDPSPTDALAYTDAHPYSDERGYEKGVRDATRNAVPRGEVYDTEWADQESGDFET